MTVPDKHWRLRPYREDDLDEALALWQRAWQRTYPDIDFSARLPWWRQRWLNEMLPVGEVMIGEAGDSGVAGFLVLTPATCYIDQIVVDPRHWGSGLAGRLIGYARTRCPEHLELHVNQSNVRALAFYRRHGFEIAGTAENPRSGLPTYLMRWQRAKDQRAPSDFSTS